MRYLIFFLMAVGCLGQTAFVSGAVGDYVLWPSSTSLINAGGGLSTWTTLNASNLKAGQCGYLITAAYGTKALQNIHVLPGAITKAGGTDLRVGIQSASTTTGPPIQADGTWLSSGNAYATIADSGLVANVWLRSGTVGGTLSMSPGTLYCLVAEPENYSGSDSILLRAMGMRTTPPLGVGIAYNGSAWSVASANGIGIHLLEFTDGTFGYLGATFPINATPTAVSFNSGSANDEIALKVSPANTLGVVGICAENPYSTSTGDADFVLYNGTTVMATASVDAQQFYGTATTVLFCAMFSSVQTLSSGNTYYAAIKPTSANNVRVVYSTAADAGYWAVASGGTATSYSARADGGSWTDTTTRRPSIWLLVTGAGSSGGGSTGGSFVVAQ